MQNIIRIKISLSVISIGAWLEKYLELVSCPFNDTKFYRKLVTQDSCLKLLAIVWTPLFKEGGEEFKKWI